MMKQSNVVMEAPRISQPQTCKYKMRVSLAEDLNLMRQLEQQNKENRHNQSTEETKSNETKPIKKSVSFARLSKHEMSALSRQASRADLNHNNKMIRSTSQLSRTSKNVERSHQKTDIMAYRSLLRAYEKVVKNNHLPPALKQLHIFTVLSSLGFLAATITPEEQAMLSTIRHMLGRQQGIVNHQNLFIFLLILTNINLKIHESAHESAVSQLFSMSNAAISLSYDREPRQPIVMLQIGTFSKEGRWQTTSDERKKIRHIFGKMYLNKISSEEGGNHHLKSVNENDKPSFQPKILKRSRSMAQVHRDRIMRQAYQYCDVRQPTKKEQIDLADLLVLGGKVVEEKNQQKLKEKEELERSQCTFQPKINKTVESLQTDQTGNSGNTSKDRCHDLFLKSKNKKSLKLNEIRPSLEQQELKQLKQCTFKPTSTKYKVIRQNPYPHRNEKKIIERMKEGRQQRILHQTIHNRGYPQNRNWQSFLKDYRRKSQIQSSQQTSTQNAVRKTLHERVPLLSMDIRLHSDVYQIEIFDGDTIESLTCKILVRHELPYDRFEKIAALISGVIEGCQGLKITNGVVTQDA